MSFGEWVTVLSVTGVVGAIIVACFIYLIKQLMKGAAATAVAEQKAKTNAIAVEELKRADQIVAERVELIRISERMRSGNF